MSKFKIGDDVAKTDGKPFVNGATFDTIRKVDSDGNITLYCQHGAFTCDFLNHYKAQSKYPNPPHVHADVIIEWAKGADIEYLDGFEEKWDSCDRPRFYSDDSFRVALTPSELADIKTRAKIDKYLAKIEKLKLTLSNGSDE